MGAGLILKRIDIVHFFTRQLLAENFLNFVNKSRWWEALLLPEGNVAELSRTCAFPYRTLLSKAALIAIYYLAQNKLW